MNYKVAKTVSLSIAFLWIAACSRDPSPVAELGGAIKAERQVFYAGLKANPKSLRRTSSGEFLFALSLSTAIAVMTDSQGILKWKYEEPYRGGLGFDVESEFNDAVPLENGNILFCGRKLRAFQRGAGFIMIFNPAGQNLEERVMIPNEKNQYVDGNFLHCFPWNDGVALVGVAQHETEGVIGWIVKLDRSGKKEWEVSDRAFIGRQAIPSKDGDMSAAAYDVSIHVARVNKQGGVRARREFQGSAGALLNSTEATNNTYLLVYGKGGQMSLYVLDDHLNETQTPIQMSKDIDVTSGCGYVRADGSVALFGRTEGAIRALFSKSGSLEYATSFGNPPSFTIVDAVPIGENQFVSLRTIDSSDDFKGTLRLAWDSFK
jgi:hypothetical protein